MPRKKAAHPEPASAPVPQPNLTPPSMFEDGYEIKQLPSGEFIWGARFWVDDSPDKFPTVEAAVANWNYMVFRFEPSS